MTLRWLLAAGHLLALGIGLGAVWARGRALRRPLDAAGLRQVFSADAWWGIAFVLWLGTGLFRAFGPYEKGPVYYFGHPFFHAKLGLLLLILALEIWPMVALIRWRIAARTGAPVDTARAGTFARISAVQAVVVIAMVGLATAVARGMRP
jgi:putative membrane protein